MKKVLQILLIMCLTAYVYADDTQELIAAISLTWTDDAGSHEQLEGNLLKLEKVYLQNKDNIDIAITLYKGWENVIPQYERKLRKNKSVKRRSRKN